MTFRFYRTKTRKDAISWMLLLAFLSLTLFPHHYHLHHVTDPAVQAPDTHEHATDVHVYAAVDHGEEGGHIIKSVADAPFKVQGGKLNWVVALMTFLLFLPLAVLVTRLHPPSFVHRLPRFNRRTVPPLRAPPRV